MSFNGKKLYELLPAIYRIRDAQQGEPLKAMLSVVAEQIGVLEEDLAQLYDDQFIETCAPWVIPYIGDLVGYRSVYGKTPKISSLRAEVANTIAHRRRKGTTVMLEELARDVTGWNARVTEFFQLLATTQHVNHIRRNNLQTPDLRRWEPLEYRNTPFDSLAHNVDVRRIAVKRGRYNIPNIGIFLWRLNVYSFKDSIAYPVDDRRYLFCPFGRNMQLLLRPQSEDDPTLSPEPINAPMPISRRALREHLVDYYGENKSIFIEGVAVDQIVVCDLSDNGKKWVHEPPSAKVAIDPVLGRIAFPDSPERGAKDSVKVTYHYGFGADIGGGEYDRAASFDAQLSEKKPIYVSQHANRDGEYTSIQQALESLDGDGVIEIADNGRYADKLTKDLAPGTRVELRAANKCHPILEGGLQVKGGNNAELILNGIMVCRRTLDISEVKNLSLRHCTLVPGTTSLRLNLKSDKSATGVEINHSIISSLRISSERSTLNVQDSIIHSMDSNTPAIAGIKKDKPGPSTTLERATIIGTIYVKELKASNVIFTGSIASDMQQTGCIRFSYIPPGSQTPRSYRCQPDLAVQKKLEEELEKKTGLTPEEIKLKKIIEEEITLRLKPVFTDLHYGNPGYCQLLLQCPVEISQGADDGAEMGVFHDLFQPQRETNLQVRLNEYLRFGLEAGIFYVR